MPHRISFDAELSSVESGVLKVFTKVNIDRGSTDSPGSEFVR